jgi:signal transduction histidine kinase
VEKPRTTLYQFIQNKCFLYEESETSDYVFKKKSLRQSTHYIQLRASLINNGRKVIIFFNDITKIKELEILSHKVSAMFLSSVAHELRTPLNSIIPIAGCLRGRWTDRPSGTLTS